MVVGHLEKGARFFLDFIFDLPFCNTSHLLLKVVLLHSAMEEFGTFKFDPSLKTTVFIKYEYLSKRKLSFLKHFLFFKPIFYSVH